MLRKHELSTHWSLRDDEARHGDAATGFPADSSAPAHEVLDCIQVVLDLILPNLEQLGNLNVATVVHRHCLADTFPQSASGIGLVTLHYQPVTSNGSMLLALSTAGELTSLDTG